MSRGGDIGPQLGNRLSTPELELVRRPVIRAALAIAGLSFLTNFGTLVVPLYNMQIFTTVLPSRDLSSLASLAVGMAFGLACWGVLEALRGFALELLATRTVRTLALPLLETATRNQQAETAAAECLSDLETLRVFLSNRACLAPFDIAWSPILLCALLAMHWALGLLGLISLAILGALNFLGETVSRGALVEANKSSATALRDAADAVQAADAVLAMGMLPAVLQKWCAGQRRAAASVHRAILRARAVSASTNALRSLMTGAMVALGLILALNNMTNSASMVAGNMVLARLLMPFAGIAATRRQWIDAMAAWQRVRARFESSVPARNLSAMPAPTPRLVVENLSYVPPRGDRPLLRGVSVTFEPGDVVAVLGPSSAGKTTLLRALVGLVPPTAGGVYLDGNSTYLWEREDFARHVGYLPQRPTLLEESVADNIARMSDPFWPDVMRVTRATGLHDIIAALPAGYGTVVKGGLLSGGQRQRLALARALYGDPCLLVLDEPDAFLDEAGEALLIALLRRMRAEGKTVILTTHRPALLQGVTKVLVLREGMVESFAPAVSATPQGAKFRVVRSVKAGAAT